MNASLAMKQYGAVSRDAAVLGADSHNLILLLMKGCLEALAQAKGALQQGNIEMRGKKITRASEIIMGLRDFLDTEKGGELAQNLDALYDYMVRALWDAHKIPSEEKIDEVYKLMTNVASAWAEIGNEVHASK